VLSVHRLCVKQTCSHTAQQFKVLVFAVLLQLAFLNESWYTGTVLQRVGRCCHQLRLLHTHTQSLYHTCDMQPWSAAKQPETNQAEPCCRYKQEMLHMH
jgi:hypothetical protein